MLRCPACKRYTVVALDIESLSNATVLVKTENRIQLCCQACGWMGFDDVSLV